MKSTSYSPFPPRLRRADFTIIRKADEAAGLKIIKDHVFHSISDDKLARLNKLAAERPFSNWHKPKRHDPL